jgi:hypothetical protein
MVIEGTEYSDYRTGTNSNDVMYGYGGDDMRVLKKQWQGEFCRCSIDVVGGKLVASTMTSAFDTTQVRRRKRANQWRNRLLTRSIATVSSFPI